MPRKSSRVAISVMTRFISEASVIVSVVLFLTNVSIDAVKPTSGSASFTSDCFFLTDHTRKSEFSNCTANVGGYCSTVQITSLPYSRLLLFAQCLAGAFACCLGVLALRDVLLVTIQVSPGHKLFEVVYYFCASCLGVTVLASIVVIYMLIQAGVAIKVCTESPSDASTCVCHFRAQSTVLYYQMLPPSFLIGFKCASMMIHLPTTRLTYVTTCMLRTELFGMMDCLAPLPTDVEEYVLGDEDEEDEKGQGGGKSAILARKARILQELHPDVEYHHEVSWKAVRGLSVEDHEQLPDYHDALGSSCSVTDEDRLKEVSSDTPGSQPRPLVSQQNRVISPPSAGRPRSTHARPHPSQSLPRSTHARPHSSQSLPRSTHSRGTTGRRHHSRSSRSCRNSEMGTQPPSVIPSGDENTTDS